MASLQTKTFATIVGDVATATQGAAKALVDFTIGSILRSFTEAVASVVLWLQGLILALLATTRASTSTGSDLDSWMADFGVTRLAAVAATGTATFARASSGIQALIQVGTLIQTTDGTQQFAVIVDATNAAWSSSQNGYVVPAGTASINLLVQAVTAGSTGNVTAGTINVLAQAIAGIDTVTNAAAFVTGVDAEKDPALLSRFVAYIASLSKATKAAVGYAITSLKLGLTYTLVEKKNFNGTDNVGYFYVVVDDGSGNPSAQTLANVSIAIDAVRPLSISFGVFPPVVLAANVVMTVTAASGYVQSAVAATVAASLANYIAALPLGTSLPWSRLIQVAYDATPGVAKVVSATLNGGNSDITATNINKIVAGTVAVS